MIADMADTWPEVQQAAKENRRELTLHGQSISNRIEDNGLDPGIFKLSNLNYLDISKTCLRLTESGSGLSQLVNLTNLILHNNMLTCLPDDISKLVKMKLLDVSNNQITSFPSDLSGLTSLQSLNVSMNKLSSFPSVKPLVLLHVSNFSHNELQCLPEGIFSPDLEHLSQIIANNNQVTEIEADVCDLPHLNTLDLSDNKLSTVPSELSECPKLKELNLKGNKFKDRRFGKLVEQCQTKSVMDYLSTQLKKEREASGKKGKGKDKDRKKKGKKDDVEEIAKNIIEVLRFVDDAGCTVEVRPAVLSVRQYIVCCIVRNLDFCQSNNMFKNFITLQTKLHDGICQKRQAATIATHNLKTVKHPLTYDARFPQHLKIVPLFKQKESTGEKLVADLTKEADDLRKEKKRNTVSGIHKYLDLLADKLQYPCLVDGDGHVISFPPITNSDITKISKETTDIFVEVTSSTSLDVCKKAMDELLIKMLEMGVGTGKSEDTEAAGDGACAAVPKKHTLTVEQVKIVDQEGSLKVLYPSRTDLPNDAIEVIRNYD